MNIVPTRVQEQIDRVDRTPSLVIAISSGLTAIWALTEFLADLYGNGAVHRRLSGVAGLSVRVVDRGRCRGGNRFFRVLYPIRQASVAAVASGEEFNRK